MRGFLECYEAKLCKRVSELQVCAGEPIADVVEADKDIDVALAVVDDAFGVYSFYLQILYKGLTDLRKDEIVVETIR